MNSSAISSRYTFRLAALAACLVMALGWSASAKADFLDDLFGGGSEPAHAAPSAPARAPRAKRAQPTGHISFSIRANDSRRSVVRKTDEAKNDQPKFPKAVFCATNVPARTAPASAEVRMADGTLRAGDSVVTSGGILVFKGHAACPHNAADFVSLAQSKLPRDKRNALESLEHTMKTSHNALVLTEKDEEPQVVGQVSQGQ